MNTNWYFSRGEATEGPVTEEQLIALITGRLITGEHFIVREGSEEWQTVAQSEFAARVPAAPRVLPAAVRVTAAPAPVVAEKRRPMGLIVAISVAALVVIGAGTGFLMSRRGARETIAATPERTVAFTPAPAKTTNTSSASPGEAAGPAESAPASQPTSLPPTMVAKSPKVPAEGPLQYFGKTLEEGDKLLGEHTSEETVEQPLAGTARFYKSPFEKVSQVRLIRAAKTPEPQPFPNGVTHITYCFPKGTVKLWREAFAAIGLPAGDLDDKAFPGFIAITGLPDGYFAQWFTVTGEPDDPNANLKEDMLVFQPDPNWNQ